MKMCQALAQNGHDVTLFASQEISQIEPDITNAHAFYGVEESFDLQGIPLGHYPGRGWRYSWDSFKAVKTLQPDLVYCRNLRGCALAALRGYPTILELHTLRFARSAGDRLMLFVLGRSPALKRVVVISNGLRMDLLRTANLDVRKILVAHDGADLADKHKKPPELQAHHKGLQVGYVGHLYRGRGVELICELAKRLADVDFHVVGGQPTDIARVQQSAVLAPNLHLHGFRPHRDAGGFRTNCDVLIAPYQTEVGTRGGLDTSHWMSPLKIFEYMAAGKPIVCSDLPVLREVLEHQRTALMVPPDDIDAWASAIRLLGQNPNLRRRLGAAALQELRERYTWQQRARDVLQGIPAA